MAHQLADAAAAAKLGRHIIAMAMPDRMLDVVVILLLDCIGFEEKHLS